MFRTQILAWLPQGQGRLWYLEESWDWPRTTLKEKFNQGGTYLLY